MPTLGHLRQCLFDLLKVRSPCTCSTWLSLAALATLTTLVRLVSGVSPWTPGFAPCPLLGGLVVLKLELPRKLLVQVQLRHIPSGMLRHAGGLVKCQSNVDI